MKFNLICDESGTSERFLVVGGLTLPRKNHETLATELAALKKSKGFRPEGEFKWGKVSKGYLAHYKELLEWFFRHLKSNHLRFRAHVVDTSAHVYRQYGDGDREKAFYKIFYHLLFQSVRRLALEEEGSNVLILLDDKTNRYPFRLPVLKKALNAGLKRELGVSGLVANVEPRQSSGANAEPLIQIADILIGAIGYVRNGHLNQPGASPAKVEMVKFLEGLAGTGFAFDTAARAPFNLWTFDVAVAIERKQSHQKKNRSKT
ncbi:MAG TPA: DUF3800 domain-containing protein [Candidatus Aquilonibacter sp.]|nr:DUF3800 domain-containing protein [Candidatus Aquilonibacter sp.]